MGKIKVTTDNDELYNADQAVRSFVKDHENDLNEDEHRELRHLLQDRAKALSNVLGIKISSIADDD